MHNSGANSPEAPRSDLVACPRCTTRWRHRESVGHCAACHHTFIGVSAFDRHQHLNDAGRSVCLDPADEQREDGNPAFEAVEHTSSFPSGSFWRAWSSEESKAKARAHFERMQNQRDDAAAR